MLMKTLATFLLASCALSAQANGFADPLDTPAAHTQRLTQSPLLAIDNAGPRLVAVGLRGLIVYSDNQGQNWQQASSPVSTDLVSVHFINPQQGWASGHDGVILHSSDGGKSWARQLDGRQLSKLIVSAYEQQAQAGDAAATAALKQARDIARDGTALALLGINFTDEQHGYAVGSFGLIIGSSDGGKSWQPLLHMIDNPQGLHLNAIRGEGDALYIAAERGTVFRMDHGRFISSPTSYAGSFLDLVIDGTSVLAYGLRGHVFRSDDAGVNWQEVQTGLDNSITAGVRADNGFLLLSQGGRAILSTDQGRSFAPLPLKNADLFSGIVSLGKKQFIAVGLNGITRLGAAPEAH
jgi:photosystem II stability/assembly factor-like uncharacterized protein